MHLNGLQAFVAVAETGSFSKAAESLFLSQPAVSRRVSALESDLGALLLDRAGNRIRLTEAGTELLPRAKAVLLELADIKRHITNLSGEVSGTLLMGTSHHIGLHRLPPVLEAFSHTYPRVRLDIRFMDSEVICEEVEKGELELGIVTLPPSAPRALRTEPLWNDPLEVAVGHGHPLAGNGKVTRRELLRHVAVLPSSDTFTGAILREALGKDVTSLRTGMATNYLETLRMLAVTGLGWTLLPRTMHGDDTLAVEVSGLRLERTLGFVTHSARTLSNGARAMIATARRFAR